MPLGQPTYLAAKANGDQSMLGTRVSLEDVSGEEALDPRNTVRAALLKVQCPVMECHILRRQRLMRSRWNTTKFRRSSETLVQWTMTSEVIQGHEQTTYVTLTTSSTVGMRD